MQSFIERRRSTTDTSQIRPGLGANAAKVASLEESCVRAGMKMTSLRRVVLHGVIEAGPNATGVTIWKTILDMVKGGSASQASVQRTLNLMVDLGVLLRVVDEDRHWRYALASEHVPQPVSIVFTDAHTGDQVQFDEQTVMVLLDEAAAKHDLVVRSAAVSLVPLASAGVHRLPDLSEDVDVPLLHMKSTHQECY